MTTRTKTYSPQRLRLNSRRQVNSQYNIQNFDPDHEVFGYLRTRRGTYPRYPRDHKTSSPTSSEPLESSEGLGWGTMLPHTKSMGSADQVLGHKDTQKEAWDQTPLGQTTGGQLRQQLFPRSMRPPPTKTTSCPSSPIPIYEELMGDERRKSGVMTFKSPIQAYPSIVGNISASSDDARIGGAVGKLSMTPPKLSMNIPPIHGDILKVTPNTEADSQIELAETTDKAMKDMTLSTSTMARTPQVMPDTTGANKEMFVSMLLPENFPDKFSIARQLQNEPDGTKAIKIELPDEAQTDYLEHIKIRLLDGKIVSISPEGYTTSTFKDAAIGEITSEQMFSTPIPGKQIIKLQMSATPITMMVHKEPISRGKMDSGIKTFDLVAGDPAKSGSDSSTGLRRREKEMSEQIEKCINDLKGDRKLEIAQVKKSIDQLKQIYLNQRHDQDLEQEYEAIVRSEEKGGASIVDIMGMPITDDTMIADLEGEYTLAKMMKICQAEAHYELCINKLMQITSKYNSQFLSNKKGIKANLYSAMQLARRRLGRLVGLRQKYNTLQDLDSPTPSEIEEWKKEWEELEKKTAQLPKPPPDPGRGDHTPPPYIRDSETDSSETSLRQDEGPRYLSLSYVDHIDKRGVKPNGEKPTLDDQWKSQREAIDKAKDFAGRVTRDEKSKIGGEQLENKMWKEMCSACRQVTFIGRFCSQCGAIKGHPSAPPKSRFGKVDPWGLTKQYMKGIDESTPCRKCGRPHIGGCICQMCGGNHPTRECVKLTEKEAQAFTQACYDATDKRNMKKTPSPTASELERRVTVTQVPPHLIEARTVSGGDENRQRKSTQRNTEQRGQSRTRIPERGWGTSQGGMSGTGGDPPERPPPGRGPPGDGGDWDPHHEDDDDGDEGPDDGPEMARERQRQRPRRAAPGFATYSHNRDLNQTQITLDTSGLENTFGQLSTSIRDMNMIQQQANQMLAEQMNATQIIQSQQSNVLQEIVDVNKMKHYDYVFTDIPIFSGEQSKCEDWIAQVETVSAMTDRPCREIALTRARGSVVWLLNAMHMKTPWSKIKEELQRNFSDIKTPVHAAQKIESFPPQIPGENLRNYITKYSNVLKRTTSKPVSLITDLTRKIHFLDRLSNEHIKRKVMKTKPFKDNLESPLGELFEYALSIEGECQLMEAMARGQSSQVMSVENTHNNEEENLEEADQGNTPRNPINVRCWFCGKKGHYSTSCTAPIKAPIVGKIEHTLHASTPIDKELLTELMRQAMYDRPFQKQMRRPRSAPGNMPPTITTSGQIQPRVTMGGTAAPNVTISTTPQGAYKTTSSGTSPVTGNMPTKMAPRQAGSSTNTTGFRQYNNQTSKGFRYSRPGTPKKDPGGKPKATTYPSKTTGATAGSATTTSAQQQRGRYFFRNQTQAAPPVTTIQIISPTATPTSSGAKVSEIQESGAFIEEEEDEGGYETEEEEATPDQMVEYLIEKGVIEVVEEVEPEEESDPPIQEEEEIPSEEMKQ